MPSGLISMSPSGIGAKSVSATSFGKGAADRPWNERVQSTVASALGSGVVAGAAGSWSDRPCWRLRAVSTGRSELVARGDC